MICNPLGIILSQSNIILQLPLSLWIALARFKLDDQIILDSEDRIVFKILGLGVENLGCDGFVAVFGDLKQDVSF